MHLDKNDLTKTLQNMVPDDGIIELTVTADAVDDEAFDVRPMPRGQDPYSTYTRQSRAIYYKKTTITLVIKSRS